MRWYFLALALAASLPQQSALAAGDNKADTRVVASDALDVTSHPGKALFEETCASCHQGGYPKAPHKEFLEGMTPTAILGAMNSGAMRQQAAGLSQAQRRQIAEYLTRTDLATYKPAPGPVMCTGEARRFDLTRPPARASWGYDTKRAFDAKTADLAAADVPNLKLKWAFGFPGAMRARSQPVAAMGALFVGSQDGTLYAFDLATGCARWTSQVTAEVRTAIVVEPWEPGTKPKARPRLFFGDFNARVHAMDAQTGKLLWTVRVDDHANATITGAPTLIDGKIIVPISSLEVVTASDPNYECCTFRGSVVALDPASGRMLWRHYTVEDEPKESRKTSAGVAMLGPSGAPVWGSPAVDPARHRIYHGSGENYSTPADGNSDALFAVDARTGKRVWKFQLTHGDSWNGTCQQHEHPNCPVENGPDYDLSASPMLVDIGEGRQLVVVGQKSGMVYGVNPDDGAVVWGQRVGRGGIQGGIHFGMAAADGRIYVGINDLPMQADGRDAQDYGFPGVHALDARTGAFVWRHVVPNSCNGLKFCDPGVSAAVTVMPGVVFAGHMDGQLRAYDSATGRVIWTTDTARTFTGANGQPAKGASIGGPGVTLIDGHVVTNSGYGFSSHMPGNALLVYSVDGK